MRADPDSTTVTTAATLQEPSTLSLSCNSWTILCRPIVILAERDKLAMDAELKAILTECKLKVITREGQQP